MEFVVLINGEKVQLPDRKSIIVAQSFINTVEFPWSSLARTFWNTGFVNFGCYNPYSIGNIIFRGGPLFCLTSADIFEVKVRMRLKRLSVPFCYEVFRLIENRKLRNIFLHPMHFDMQGYELFSGFLDEMQFVDCCLYIFVDDFQFERIDKKVIEKYNVMYI